MNLDDIALYPLHFAPVYKSRIWGGTLIHETYGREVPQGAEPTGEAWEISDRDDAPSTVDRGALAGTTLRELLQRRHGELLGPACSGRERFPLLVKLIDAGERLSLQVHPDERACAEIGGGAEPKTEMWYILNARRDAKIFAGIGMRCTRVRMTEMLASPDVAELLQTFPSQIGDAYFITSGMLHAIGGGNLLLEIQQNSDTTYRVSDWGRVDAQGKSRQLHIEQAMKSIDFTNRANPRVPAESGAARTNRKASLVKNCRNFTVDCLHLVEPWHDTTRQSGSFHLLSAADAPFRVEKASDPACFAEAAPGETLLIPFAIGDYRVIPLAGNARAVRTTL